MLNSITGLVLIVKHIKECLTMFGVVILTQIVNMEFIQTNKYAAVLQNEIKSILKDPESLLIFSAWMVNNLCIRPNSKKA